MRGCVNGLVETRAEDGLTVKLQRELESLSHVVAKAQVRGEVQVTLLAAPQLLSAMKLA